MRRFRAERLAELIHKDVARRLREEVKDARLGDVSITHVVVQGDLRRATLYFTPLGGGEVGRDLVAALEDAARQMRGPVGRALGIRFSPELVFTEDKHIARAVHMTGLLDRIGRELGRPEEGEE